MGRPAGLGAAVGLTGDMGGGKMKKMPPLGGEKFLPKEFFHG